MVDICPFLTRGSKPRDQMGQMNEIHRAMGCGRAGTGWRKVVASNIIPLWYPEQDLVESPQTCPTVPRSERVARLC
jgi:hypothetical protein